MSKPQEEREFSVKLVVWENNGAPLERNYAYSPNKDYTEEIRDMVETHLEAEDL